MRELMPEDPILVRVDKALDLSWLRDEVWDCSDLDQGRPGIDPEVAVRLMLAGLLSGIVHERKLPRGAQVDLAIRRFVGYRLDERLPDHSSLSRIRRRRGAQRFRRIFARTVLGCLEAGPAKVDPVHLDATPIRAEVSRESLVKVHVEALGEANADNAGDEAPPSQTGARRRSMVCSLPPGARKPTTRGRVADEGHR
ncbi:MAG: hypothetical protein GWN08_14050 [Gemmatimonadetes bacterium]|nr:hypothetical protein [Gemmatimonadota bacterium]